MTFILINALFYLISRICQCNVGGTCLSSWLVLCSIRICGSILRFWCFGWVWKVLILRLNFLTTGSFCRKFTDYYCTAKMREAQKACNNIISPLTHLLRLFILCNNDAYASRTLLLSRMDIRWFSMSNISICVLQQRLHFNVIYDSHDYQSLHPHHVSTFISENLHNQIDYYSIVLCLVYCLLNYGRFYGFLFYYRL